MSLKAKRTDPATGNETLVEAPELFGEPEVPAVPQMNLELQQSGARLLVESILREYTSDQQDIQWEILQAFFELYRGGAKFGDFLSLFDLAWSDAESQCGLEMNDIGNTYFVQRGQLSERQLFDVRLQVDGDLSKYR